MFEVLLLHNPSRVCELNTLLIWFADAVHLSRISETAFPKVITDNFHFCFLGFYHLELHLGLCFSTNFSQVNINLTREIWARFGCLLGDRILDIYHMLLELLDIYTSGVVNLCLCSNILECVQVCRCIIGMKNRHDRGLVLLRRCSITSRLTNKLLDRLVYTPRLILHHQE